MVKLPPDLHPYIRSFDVCTSTNRLQACTCTFGDTLSISFTSPFVSTDIQKRFFRKLTAQGIPLEVAACGEEEQEVQREIL